MKKLLTLSLLLIATMSLGQPINEYLTSRATSHGTSLRDVLKSGPISSGTLSTPIPTPSNRVLSDEEREALKGDPEFLYRCQWAVRNYASYWAAHDGSGLSTEADRLKWAKDRQLSVGIINNDINDSNLALKFVVYSKSTQFNLEASPVITATIITAWVSGNRFDEFASKYFDSLGEAINLSTTGN